MNKLLCSILLLITSHSLTANPSQLAQARSDLLAGHIDEADQILQAVLSSAPQNTEARLLKCLSEMGLFLENDFAHFLINSLGTNATRTAEALDLSKLISSTNNEAIVPFLISNPDESESDGSILYEWTRPKHSLTELNDNEPGEDSLSQLFDYSIESQLTVDMTRRHGVFSTPEGVRRCGISFRFTGSKEEQVDFQLTINQSDFDAPLKVYFNGMAIGEIHSSWGNLNLGGKSIYLNSTEYFSVRMQPGDLVSFEVQQTDRSNLSTYQGSPTEVSILALDPWVLDFENGVIYTSYFPKLEQGANLHDLSKFLLRENNPLDTLLLSIKTHLQAIPTDSSVTFLPMDTGMPVNLIIEAVDIQMLLTLVETVQAFQILGDAYNYSIDISHEHYKNILQNLLNLDDFKRLLPSFLGVRDAPERLVVEAKTLLTSALNRYLNNEAILWNRVSNPYDSYLFEINSSQASSSQQDWSTAIIGVIKSLSEFTPASDISSDTQSGFEFTLAPLFELAAFDFKDDLLSENWEHSDYSFYHFAAENSFARNLLPSTFDGMCLARYDERSELHEVDLIIKTDGRIQPYQYAYYYDDEKFDPFKGELVLAPNQTSKRYTNGDLMSNGSYELIQLTAETEYGGTWKLLESYMPSESNTYLSPISTGRYVLYPGVMDVDNDGMPDGQQLLQGYRVLAPTSLTSNDITQSEYAQTKAYQPKGLAGKILIADTDLLDISNYSYQANSNETEVVSFINTDTLLRIEFDSANFTEITKNYRYEPSYRTSAIKLKADLYDPVMTGGLPEKIVTFYKSAYQGAGFSLLGRDDTATNDMARYFNFTLYPATLDLDKNGAPDGYEMMLGQKLDLDELPRAVDIESFENKAIDGDEDGLPDLLEARYGGSGSNPNDSDLTTSYLLNNDLYTQSEAHTMAVNTGINQVVQNPASYNLYTAESIKELQLSRLTIGPIYGDTIDVNYTIEESQTLGEWSPMETGTIQLPMDQNKRFIRMRMSD